MRASRSGHQIDWRSTVRAINGLNILSQLFDLVRRQRTNEVLFPQEIEKADELSVPVITAPIIESGVSLYVMGQQ